MVKIYEERNAGRTMIAVHVLVTAFCQGVLVTLLFNEVIGQNIADF